MEVLMCGENPVGSLLGSADDTPYENGISVGDALDNISNSIAQKETSPSTHAYDVGDYLTYNGILYVVTSPITVGGVITPNTNVNAVKLVDISGGGGSGSGHTIVDDGGTAIGEKSNLQFKGVYVHNSGSNTIVEVAREISSSDFNNLSSAEKKGIIRTTDDNKTYVNGTNITPSTIDITSIATVETSPTTNSYATGTHLVYNGILYKVIAPISQGGTLTVGTNIQADTLQSQIDAVGIKKITVSATIPLSETIATATTGIAKNRIISIVPCDTATSYENITYRLKSDGNIFVALVQDYNESEVPMVYDFIVVYI